MKKQDIILTLILTFCLFYIPSVFASTNTYERTETDYRVPNRITVTSSNKSAVLKTPSVDESEKIYDFANLLTEVEEQKLYSEVTDFISKTNYDLAIVTIDYNDKYSAKKYSDDFFDYNYFGKNSSRDGFVILIDMDNREIYISTSGYAIKMYSDSRIQSIIDDGFYDLKNANYYECLSKMIDKSYYYYQKNFPSSNNIIINNDGSITVIKKMPYLMIAIISITFCAIMSSILYFKTSSKIKKENTVTYINPNLSNIIKNDQFLTTHTTKIRRESSSSSGGGSSHHSSSSGRSHGGGGRHF